MHFHGSLLKAVHFQTVHFNAFIKVHLMTFQVFCCLSAVLLFTSGNLNKFTLIAPMKMACHTSWLQKSLFKIIIDNCLFLPAKSCNQWNVWHNSSFYCFGKITYFRGERLSSHLLRLSFQFCSQSYWYLFGCELTHRTFRMRPFGMSFLWIALSTHWPTGRFTNGICHILQTQLWLENWQRLCS